MRKVALDPGVSKTTFCEVAAGQVVKRATVSDVQSLRPLLGPNQEPARVAIEACREAWHVHDLLVSWGNEVLVVDTTRSKELGIGRHGRKNDRIDAEVWPELWNGEVSLWRTFFRRIVGNCAVGWG